MNLWVRDVKDGWVRYRVLGNRVFDGRQTVREFNRMYGPLKP